VAGAAVLGAPVEGQKESVLAGQAGGHGHLVLTHREMHQGTAPEGEQRLRLARDRVLHRAVPPVLAPGVLHRLLELALELQGGGGDAVDEQHQVQPRVVVPGPCVRRVRDLRHHAQAVGAVTRQRIGVHAVIGAEAAQIQLHPGHLDAVAQHLECAGLVEPPCHRAHQRALRILRVPGRELVPALWPGFLDVADQILGVEGVDGVVAARRTDPPPGGSHRLDDVLLEPVFPGIGHSVSRAQGSSTLASAASATSCSCHSP
jgi:hypothetical protein